MPYFEEEGMTTKIFSYGWIGPMGVWFLNPRIVKQLIPHVHEGDCGVAHSNGCVLLLMASIYGAPFSNFIFINPALSSNAPPAPSHVKKVLVICNDQDYPVMFAAWLRQLAPWAPIGDPLWGDMGARGYQPGPYLDSNYVPKKIFSKVIHVVNSICARKPLLLTILRIIVGIPLVLCYWLFLSPLEVLLTFLFNNVLGKEPSMALDITRLEDRRFVTVGFLLPTFFWIFFLFV
jgi:hypothetical protein